MTFYVENETDTEYPFSLEQTVETVARAVLETLSNFSLFPHKRAGQESKASYGVMSDNKMMRHHSRKRWSIPQNS